MIVVRLEGDEVAAQHGLRVGRDPEWADLVIDKSFVSRRHMEIIPDGPGYRVWDLGSQNGTSVNARGVGASGQALHPGDVITIGDVLELHISAMTPPPMEAATTVARPDSTQLKIELHPDLFVVDYQHKGVGIRDTIPYQLGLALSILAVYHRDRRGPVPDADLRSIVWRGDKKQQEHGDINRLWARLRQWFQQRGIEAPVIVRPKRAGSSRLLLPASSVTLDPEDWLYRFIER